MNIRKLYIIGFLMIPVHILGFILSYMYMGMIIAMMVTVLCAMLSITVYHFARKSLRIKYINEYQLPQIVIRKFSSEYSYLNTKEIDLVIDALKQFFMIYTIAVSEGNPPHKGFIMPSKMVDELWHNFMLDSRHYQKFCDLAFGRMLHHKPGMETKNNNLHNLKNYPEELKNTYSHIENLKKYQSLTLLNGMPLLFAIDSYFTVSNGFYYDEAILNNIALSLNKPSATGDSSSSGGCSGILVANAGDSSGNGDSGSCGGGCGGD